MIAVLTFKVQYTVMPAYLSCHIQIRNCGQNLWLLDSFLLCPHLPKLTSPNVVSILHLPSGFWNLLSKTVITFHVQNSYYGMLIGQNVLSNGSFFSDLEW